LEQTWGIIGFGEAGSTFAAHVSQRNGIRLLITDPVLNEARSAAALCAKLNGAIVEVMVDVPALVESTEMCLSLVTPRAAIEVARQAASVWQQGLFVDFNSVSPVEKSEMAALFPPGVFVGGAILGSVAGEGAASALALDGPSAGRAQALLNAAGFRSNAISTKPGAAAALKMCRSVFMKGMECLLVETLLAASSFEITEAVLASIEQTFESYGFRPLLEILITTHAVHCARRSDEMERVAAMLSSMHLPSPMSEASRDLLTQSRKSGVTEHFRGMPSSTSQAIIEYLKNHYEEKL
jgi:3-hydroxyisobutyrate dehydrogenase-like beta-hydroxyacid dehydrogenase